MKAYWITARELSIGKWRLWYQDTSKICFIHTPCMERYPVKNWITYENLTKDPKCSYCKEILPKEIVMLALLQRFTVARRISRL